MTDKLSVVIPAYNEEKNIVKCLEELRATLRDRHRIPYEVIVVNDNSRDRTEELVRAEMAQDPAVRLVNRTPPGGFGRAVRSGLEAARGDVVVIYMADLSDSPEDVVAYYRKIGEGYDCVFGSRFIKGSRVENYPRLKLLCNRVVNRGIQVMFWTRFNDLTNAFKAYRAAVIRDCGPYRACHFNLTIEMSLGALIRRYNVAQVPISWSGRTWGSSNLRLGEMGRRYLSTLLMMFFQRHLIADDLMADRLASNIAYRRNIADLEARLDELDARVEALGRGARVAEGVEAGMP
jgi:dolichol-phosphate mannosyltransferase